MKIREIAEFKTKKVEGPENAPPIITIENLKSKDSIEVIGGVLEAQYTADDSYLLFVTEGNPLEEALYIYLLDSELKIRDSLELSADYTSGFLGNIFVTELDSISFSFFDKEDNWVLTVSDDPRISFFGSKYPVKRRSLIPHKTWLQLKKGPDKALHRTSR